MEDITELRKQIDQTDAQIVALLNQRATLALAVGSAKKGATKFRPTREAAVIKQAQAASKAFPKPALAAVYREIISACLNLEQAMRVAYLGPAGTYSEEAAQARFGSSASYVPCSTLDEAVRTVEAGKADVAVVPIENSTEGAVNRTLDLLRETTLQICDELFLPIHHQLLGKAPSLKAVQTVVAHPQALAQCREWLAQHLPHAAQQAASSNGEAARLANEDVSIAAIAGRRAAVLNGLSILAEDIEDDSDNTTRFLVLGRAETQPSGADKTSLLWSVANQPGTLVELLAILQSHGVNMVKLESRPADSGLWEYVFYVDVEGHIQDAPLQAALDQIKQKAHTLKVLGSYPKAVQHVG
jgi:chorismate mutase / prephenate dehydratase